ncbi:glycerol-3-phosphate 1-O-acyltransferase PlsY [Baileyella intestinalis]|uniref:glycerol-3-phosphate 1-O-acyltransferase PlsY n=1 Tax=Baileyella intestinalis TaxID=2606709 RepID=UPI003A84D1B9
MNSVIKLLLCVAGSYLVGNISPATLIGKAYGVDIKKVGSGNAGTTNVLRTLGYGPAALTLVIDILKGFLAVRIGLNAGNLLCGELCFLAVVLGHVYPVFFHFKGGKGVATSFGAAWAINWPSAFAVLLVAAIGAGTSKKMSIGSVAACLAYPLLVLFYYPTFFPVSIIVALFVLYNHRTNIVRLYKGEEKSMSVGNVTTSDDEPQEDSEAPVEPDKSGEAHETDEQLAEEITSAVEKADEPETSDEVVEPETETLEETVSDNEPEEVEEKEPDTEKEEDLEPVSEDLAVSDSENSENSDEEDLSDIVLDEPGTETEESDEESAEAIEESVNNQEKTDVNHVYSSSKEDHHKSGGFINGLLRKFKGEDNSDETTVMEEPVKAMDLQPDEEAADIESDRDLQWIFREAMSGDDDGKRQSGADTEKNSGYKPSKGTVAMIARGGEAGVPGQTAVYYGMPMHPEYIPKDTVVVNSPVTRADEIILPSEDSSETASSDDDIILDDGNNSGENKDDEISQILKDSEFAEFDQLVEESKREEAAKKAEAARIIPKDYYKGQRKHRKKPEERKKIAFIGNGSFGTALANMLAHSGHTVTVWGRNKEYVSQMRETKVNSKYLPEVLLASSLRFTHNLKTAVHGKDVVVFSVPAQNFRQVAERTAKYLPEGAIVVNLAKGIETFTNKTMSQIAEEILPNNKYVVLSGPSHAEEIAKNKPATVVVASKDQKAAELVQDVFMSDKFRVYTSDDVLGVELGGALKNVIAIGTGISDGMGFGDNARSAIMTRGIHEITRLGVTLGARSDTFSGLSGIGDLMVTCDSDLSRNRRCGIMIGEGIKPDDAVKQIGTVEGFYTVEAACKLAEKSGVEMPITQAVNKVISGKITPAEALDMLMGRDKKDERK